MGWDELGWTRLVPQYLASRGTAGDTAEFCEVIAEQVAEDQAVSTGPCTLYIENPTLMPLEVADTTRRLSCKEEVELKRSGCGGSLDSINSINVSYVMLDGCLYLQNHKYNGCQTSFYVLFQI